MSGFKMFKQQPKPKPDDEANEPPETPAQEQAEDYPPPPQDPKKRTMFKVTKKVHKK